MRSLGWGRKLAAATGIGLLCALPFSPVLAVQAASNLAPSGLSALGPGLGSPAVADTKPTCKPDKDNDFDNDAESDNNANDDKTDKDDKGNDKCPPPVVPEAPLAALLPISAGVVIGTAYLVIRLRGRNSAAG